MSRPRARTRLAIAAATAAVLACGGSPAEPAMSLRSGPLALALQWPGAVTANAVFGAAIDSVHVFIYRNDESTAADTTIFFPPGDAGLRLAVNVSLRQEVETVYVNIDLRAGQSTLFYSYGQATLRVGRVPDAPALPLTYIGPGYDAVFLTVTPRGAFVLPNGTLPFTALAQNGQQLVVATPVAWSVSDTRLATISAAGVLTAKAGTGTLRVRATTPMGLADSVDVTIATQLP